MNRPRRIARPLLAAALAWGVGCAVAAPSYDVQSLLPAEGGTPNGRLVGDGSGGFVGTAATGGALGFGTIFHVDRHDRITVMHTFDGTDGVTILAGLARGPAPGRWLYGMTIGGGAHELGGVFRIDTRNSTRPQGFVMLHSFDDGPDHGASYPTSALTYGPDGNFYGTTSLSAGYPEHNGTLFKMTPGGAFQVIYLFGSQYRNPNAGVTFGPDGYLYGLTTTDARASCGVLYRIATDGTGFEVVHRFDPSVDGCQPVATMTADANGRLLGSTQYGGPDGGLGALFRFDTVSSTMEVMHVFHDDDPAGYIPASGLLADGAGTFHGTTSYGGDAGLGTAFALAADGTFVIEHVFAADGIDGAHPVTAPTPAGNGTLVGTTSAGGSAGQGTVYRLPSTK